MKKNEIQLPFGLQGKQIVHISQVANGIACNCVCPACHEPLIARQGAIKTHHFAHHNGTQCAMAVQTALHLESKRLLMERKEIVLPPVYIRFNSNRPPLLVSEEKRFTIDEVHEEYRTEDIVPDLLAVFKGVHLFIEIRVTHAVDNIKLNKIRRMGISAIEIDLSAIARDSSPETIASALIESTVNKKWLFNAAAARQKQNLLLNCDRKPIIQRGLALHVDQCPIPARVWNGKPYANFIDDCASCEHCLEVGEDNRDILCAGRAKDTNPNHLRSLKLRPISDINTPLPVASNRNPQ